YEALYEKYKDLKHLIALQDQKLTKLQKEQSQILEEIEVTTQSLKEKKEELKKLIENYKATLSYLYKHGRTSQLALIFSSSSINQMLIRAFYLQKFNGYREKQATDIRNTQKDLEQTKSELIDAKSKNEGVLAEIKEQKNKLADKKQQQAKNVALLRKNRQKIQNKLKEVQEQKDKLNNTLSTLIKKEEKIRAAQLAHLRKLEEERKRKLEAAKKIEDDAKRAREVAKYSKPIVDKSFMNSERLDEIEKSFAQSKGHLPWPVKSRTVSEHFGRRRHPVYGTVTQNLGVEIVTPPRAQVHAVHAGYVIDIRPIPGYGDVVVVKHGRFFTAYGNLSEIDVRKSEILQQGDIIGLAGDADSTRGESLFFLVRENNKNLDPENWLQDENLSSKY
ncbi:MAG: peptidoglycan DD-metalloendopeptidase family protein, partial [Balneolaceae bacterium]